MDLTRSYAAAAIERPGVRVRTLMALRWIAIIGQCVTLVVVGVYLEFPLAWPSLIAAVLAAVVLNAGLGTLYPRHARLEGREVLLHLAFDLVQAGVLLFLTGGLANPFSVLLLVPITISATLLSGRGMGVLMAIAAVILAILWFWAQPLPWRGEPSVVLPPIYRFGTLIGIALGLAFLAAYVWMVSREARGRARALLATQAALEREAKMSALGALAAAAAHELGGPLGTITLIARHLLESLENDPDFGEDVRLLEQEAARSRAILVGIARRAEAEDPFPRVGLDVLLHEVAHGFTPARVPVIVDAQGHLPVVRRTPELRHGLSNLVANAVRHAGSRVRIAASELGGDVHVCVEDDGAGFAAEVLPQLGEPFLGPSHSGSGGTGLGIFIATTMLERTGARLAFSNAAAGGARVELRWPRAHIEAADAG